MKTLIIGEVVEGKLSSGALEIIAKSQELGLEFEVATVGTVDSPNIGSDSFKNTYLKCNENQLSLGSVANTLKTMVDEQSISLVMAPSTYVGRDLIAFLSVDFGSSQVSNVINFSVDGENVITSNSINGGESEYNSKVTSDKKLLLIRPKSFEEVQIELNSSNYETVEINSEEPEVFDIFIEEKSGPQLEDSKIVVSAGRGMVDSSNLSLVEDLASKLNAAIGGTRAIVDAGWMPYSQQVGQTGKTVKPDVYIALGISGATQHQVGMKDSKYIIAINKDEEAPIFQIADLGLVADTLSIVPKITCLLYTSPSPRDGLLSRMPSSA